MAFQQLRLTSPHMRDHQGEHHVKHAQESLHHNRFGEFYKPSHFDGVFGPETAGAVKEAKWKLGYMQKYVNQHYDEKLDEFLNNRHDISMWMKNRRQGRIHQAKDDNNAALKAVEIALGENGYHEGSGNSSKYGAWYGLNNAPWCAMFVSWCESHAGNDWFRYSYTPAIYSAALHGVHGMRFVSSPERGDICLMHFTGGEYPVSHVGLVIDGNPWRWISGNFGDAVRVSTADRANVVRFVRLSG